MIHSRLCASVTGESIVIVHTVVFHSVILGIFVQNTHEK